MLLSLFLRRRRRSALVFLAVCAAGAVLAGSACGDEPGARAEPAGRSPESPGRRAGNPSPLPAESVDPEQEDHVLYAPGIVAGLGVESPPRKLESLQADLEAVFAAHPEAGRAAVAVTDLETGETVDVNGRRRQFSGCTINLFALIIAMRDVHEGRYSLESVDWLVRRTIMYSDPKTARELYRLAGDGDIVRGVERAWEEVSALLPGTELQLDHPPAYLWESFAGGRSNLVTAVSLNQLLFELHRGYLVPEPERTFLLNAMADVSPGLNHLLGSLLANDDVTVGHKNGFFRWVDGWVDNDAGIVDFVGDDGSTHWFAITFLSEGVELEWGDVALAREAAAIALRHFREITGGSSPEEPDVPPVAADR